MKGNLRMRGIAFLETSSLRNEVSRRNNHACLLHRRTRLTLGLRISPAEIKSPGYVFSLLMNLEMNFTGVFPTHCSKYPSYLVVSTRIPTLTEN
jgi:hypothetical protein